MHPPYCCEIESRDFIYYKCLTLSESSDWPGTNLDGEYGRIGILKGEIFHTVEAELDPLLLVPDYRYDSQELAPA